MLTIIGTIPLGDGIYRGWASFRGGSLVIGDSAVVPVERGTAALVMSALRILEHFGDERPYCLLAGDQTSGAGSRRLLDEAIGFLPASNPEMVVFHYMFMLTRYGPLLRETIGRMPARPYLIADAGGMYLAKAAGIADIFDLFTPDTGELAFLADEKAAHPMYTRPEFFRLSSDDLALRAWENGAAPSTLVVKGSNDCVYSNGRPIAAVTEPSVPSMEAVGGTGDTVTGMLAAFKHLKVEDGIVKALLLNRLAGMKMSCTPRTRIGEFIQNIDLSLLEEFKGKW